MSEIFLYIVLWMGITLGQYYKSIKILIKKKNVFLIRRSGLKLHFWNSTFNEYVNGFGDLRSDHWLGLEKVHSHFYQNNNSKFELRIVLIGDLCSNSKRCSRLGNDGFLWGDWEFSVNYFFIDYKNIFQMTGKSDFYRLEYLKFIKGTLNDGNSVDFFGNYCSGQRFTTVDMNNNNKSSLNLALFHQKG